MKLSYLFLAVFVLSTKLFAQTGTGAIPCSSSAVSPHIAFGGGWSTTIYISVDADTDQTITLNFLDASGKPLQAPISSNGLSGRTSEIILRMKKGTEAVELLGTDAQLSVGWAVAKCSGAIKPQIFEVFRSNVPGRPNFEASVPFTDVPLVNPNMVMQGMLNIPNRFTPSALPDLDLKPTVTFSFDSRNGLETGIGVVNPVAPVSETKVGIQCYSGSTLIGQLPNLLEKSTAYGAWLLSSVLPATVGQMGFCKVYGDNQYSQVPIILALRFTQGGAFSMIPVRTATEAVRQ